MRERALKPQPTPGLKIRRADRGWLHALFLLSSQLSASRSRRNYVAAVLGCQRHFFVCAVCFFEGRLTRGLRLSTGSDARQPRVESRTPPKKKIVRNQGTEGTWYEIWYGNTSLHTSAPAGGSCIKCEGSVGSLRLRIICVTTSRKWVCNLNGFDAPSPQA